MRKHKKGICIVLSHTTWEEPWRASEKREQIDYSLRDETYLPLPRSHERRRNGVHPGGIIYKNKSNLDIC